jgi:hypothetical protein
VLDGTLEDVQALSAQNYLVTANSPVNVVESCKNSLKAVNHHLKAGESKLIKLGPKCKASTKNYVFYSGQGIPIKTDIATNRPVTFNSTDLFRLIDSDPDVSALKRVVNQLNEMKPLQKIDLTSFNKQYNALKNRLHRSLYEHRSEIILGGLLMVILSILLMSCICQMLVRRDMKRNRHKGIQNPPWWTFGLYKTWYTQANSNNPDDNNDIEMQMQKPLKKQAPNAPPENDMNKMINKNYLVK